MFYSLICIYHSTNNQQRALWSLELSSSAADWQPFAAGLCCWLVWAHVTEWWCVPASCQYDYSFRTEHSAAARLPPSPTRTSLSSEAWPHSARFSDITLTYGQHNYWGASYSSPEELSRQIHQSRAMIETTLYSFYELPCETEQTIVAWGHVKKHLFSKRNTNANGNTYNHSRYEGPVLTKFKGRKGDFIVNEGTC